jgi:AcrR family transcriptional regulator
MYRLCIMSSQVTSEIVEAARRMAQDGRLREATMQDLADEAGVSRVTLYRRGATRDNVLQALRAELAREERDAIWPAIVSDGTGRERLERALRALCASGEETLGLFGALSDDVSDAIYHDGDERRLTREEFVAPFRRLLLDGAADGSLRQLPDPDEVATILYNQVSWTYRHLRSGHGWEPDRAADGVVSLALEGLATRRTGP